MILLSCIYFINMTEQIDIIRAQILHNNREKRARTQQIDNELRVSARRQIPDILRRIQEENPSEFLPVNLEPMPINWDPIDRNYLQNELLRMPIRTQSYIINFNVQNTQIGATFQLLSPSQNTIQNRVPFSQNNSRDIIEIREMLRTGLVEIGRHSELLEIIVSRLDEISDAIHNN